MDVTDTSSLETLNRFRSSLDAAVVGNWAWDHVRRVVTYDVGAAQLLTGDPDLADQEISHPIALAAVHPTDMTWLMEHMRRAVQVGGVVLAEYRVLQADGAVRWLLSRGRTYHDAAGRPARSHGILIDITKIRDGGERYVLGTDPMPEDPLLQAAGLAISLKHLLVPAAAPEVVQAANLLLLRIGHAITDADDAARH